MARRILTLVALSVAGLGLMAGPALADCNGGLIAFNHEAVLVKATSMAAWVNGYEHYVTGFEFTGPATSFGYIIPLPGVPSKIQKGGSWTLERLQGEIGEGPLAPRSPELFHANALASSSVQVIQQVKIDSLNVTVVKGGGPDVAAWARQNGFDLSPDAPQVLGAYANEGAIFALAKYDASQALSDGLVGGGVVVQFTIPTPAPWMPLRILAFGKAPNEYVNSDLFVLTEDRPTFYPAVDGMIGMQIRASEPASTGLLSDLRGDSGMSWLPPRGMWFTALTLHAPASAVTHDLSIDGGGLIPGTPIGTPIPNSPDWSLWGRSSRGALPSSAPQAASELARPDRS